MSGPVTFRDVLALAERIAAAPAASELKPPPAYDGKPILQRSASALVIDMSVDQGVAMANALVELDAIANAAADLLTAQDTCLAFSGKSLAGPALAESERADAALAEADEALTNALADLGYLTLKDPEKTDGSAD